MLLIVVPAVSDLDLHFLEDQVDFVFPKANGILVLIPRRRKQTLFVVVGKELHLLNKTFHFRELISQEHFDVELVH